MKILLIRANPRKTGYTQRLADLFAQGAREVGGAVQEIQLADEPIGTCEGCFHCWLVQPGQCFQPDAMDRLQKMVLEADVLVCATPLYFYSMSSLLKKFWERLFPLTKEGFVPTAGGLIRNSIRYPDQWRGKKLITLIVGALKDPRSFQPANDTFRMLAEGLDLELGGQLTRPECYLLDYTLSKPLALKQIEAAFIQAGREAAATGRLTLATVAAAATPLAADAAHFCTYSNLYWETASKLGEQAMAPGSVPALLAKDVRILMREMVRSFDPRAGARLKAVLQFDFPDRDQHFAIMVADGQCRMEEIRAAKPDLRVECAATDWAGLFTRQVDLRTLLAGQRLKVEGDRSLFTRLDRYFPPPST